MTGGRAASCFGDGAADAWSRRISCVWLVVLSCVVFASKVYLSRHVTALKCCVTRRLVDETLVLGAHNPFIVMSGASVYHVSTKKTVERRGALTSKVGPFVIRTQYSWCILAV